METELFMECEEEELEPWQQVDDGVEEDEMDFMDEYCEPVEDSLSPLPASETPPPRSTPTKPAPTVVSSSSMMLPRPPLVASSSSQLAPPSAAPPRVAQASPLILTQTPGGAFLLPAAPGTGSAPPILLTTQGFPVMNPVPPLVLNLQPGHTVQPVTLIQSPSLGHLVRPSVGVSPVLPQGQVVPASSGGPAQPSSTYTAMRLPASVTIRTGTPGPVNLQMTQVGGAKSMKLAATPALPSGSANGVTRIPPLSSATSVVTSAGVTAPPPDPPRVVMSVDEFYYGTFEGDLSLRKPQPLGLRTASFSCQICSHLNENNLRLMQHTLQHSELTGGGGKGDDRRGCRFCYRQFSSPSQLQTHQDQVHGPVLSSCMCRICEWAFENEPTFLNHMKSNHKPGEMPYVCQVCSYRSSFYSDVVQHFASFHRDSHFLLCVFCLKVIRNPATYQQHLLRHQINQAFHCNRCRLQFVFLKDKMQHKLENHRSFRRPVQLEGLPPGSKVTIRTYGKTRPTSAGSRAPQTSSSYLIQPINIKTEQHWAPISRDASLARSPRSQTRKPAGQRANAHRTSSEDHAQLVCLECGTDASSAAAHYPSHVRCLLCPYSSCCSRAYAAHMIHQHVPQSKENIAPLHRRPPPCVFLLRCLGCDFSPQTADHMAEHLLKNPEHHSATCHPRIYTDPDIQFHHQEELPLFENKEPVQTQDFPDPSWRSAGSWKHQSGSDSGTSSITSFTETSGPHHQLSKNGDALDFFNLLFPATLMRLIAKETNAHAKTRRFLGASVPDWSPVTTQEIKAFIGLVILMGTQNLQDPSHYWSLSNYDNSYAFYRTMTFKRFKQIAANIRMGSSTTDEYRGTTKSGDALHIFRPMLEILGEAMWNAYRPNRSLTIDRALLPSLDEERRLAKASPKTQPRVWLLCDSKSGYCHRLFIQAGEKVGQEMGFAVVPELVKGLEDKHHHLYLANSLTSVPLMQKLLDQGIYSSSSFPPPNPILPKKLWEEGSLEKPGDFVQRQFGPLLATRWKDMKEMGCLSTNAAPGEPDTVWRRSQTTVGKLEPVNRPMAFRLLQENMRGVDICKQLLACNPLGGVPLDRHWRSLFWFLVNVSIVNAFIVLRESRKDNPPTWVRDGLFSQVNFRKRLGNQLAKCAQKYFENMEIANSRAMRGEAEGREKQGHRMGKIASVSRRCKNCNFKYARQGSAHGCAVCQGNLASTKAGFLKNQISGEVEVNKIEDGVDGAMAPVEDMDFSDDEGLDDLNETDDDNEEEKTGVSPNNHVQTATVSSSSRDREDVLTARQLRIILMALGEGLHQASRAFSTDEHLIRSWQKDARRHLKRRRREKKADGEDHMVAWVLSTREQQLQITESNLFNKASALKKKGVFADSFRISYEWAVDLMLHHRLGVRSVGREATLARRLPRSLEDKIQSFREFTQKVIQNKELPGNAVAAMDELCLFVDLGSLQDKFRYSEALELTGSLSLVTVYLTLLSEGTMLPSLLLVSKKLPDKVLPEFILLQDGRESLLVEEALDLWNKWVWLPHVSRLPQPRKSMLILDRHREHLEEPFVASISGSSTLPAVIPGGGSFRLQPMEVCMKPVLQRFLMSRWSKFTKGHPKELEETSPDQLQTNVAQLLVDWVVEALTLVNKVPHLWKKSFQLTGLLPGQQEELQKPEDVQVELLKTLTQTLLGSEAMEDGSPELLELEDEEDAEEKEVRVEVKTEELGKETGSKETEGKVEEAKEESLNDAQIKSGKERDDWERDVKETEEDRKDEGGKETEEVRLEEHRKMEQEEREEEGKEAKEDREEEVKKLEEDSEEEGKETEEDAKEMSKERRETRIVIGEDVGDEWKIDGVEGSREDDRTDNS
ncbi:pogo transposable element with ZNF domain [Antennarius striatus]|uniref:pogo transposable element with ZNF domain n=1 Tax=Antennarius striatus TaxID=241820 RepID=UPI0035AEC3FE